MRLAPGEFLEGLAQMGSGEFPYRWTSTTVSSRVKVHNIRIKSWAPD